jgi:hypothetical protein
MTSKGFLEKEINETTCSKNAVSVTEGYHSNVHKNDSEESRNITYSRTRM